MSSPLSFCSRRKRRADEIRSVTVLGKTFRDAGYRPQFALGVVCRDEADQQRVFRRLKKITGDRDVKVLVI